MLHSISNLLDTKGKSILDIEKVVAWKKSKGNYNFNKLPKRAILTVFERSNKQVVFRSFKKLKGIKGKNYVISNQDIVLCTGCGYGAAYIVNLCEELRVLGVSEFIFIGVAGILVPSLKEGGVFGVEETFSGSGVSYYYENQETLGVTKWGLHVIDQLAAKPVKCWSTDAPFRETAGLRNYYLQKGATIVEMESAGVYAFASYYDVHAVCLAIGSDQLFDTWNPPQNYANLITKERAVVRQILNLA